MSMPAELHELRIFLALADELHFGRAAQRLVLTPSRVSQVIRKLERSLGAPLFERTSRSVRLTAFGEHANIAAHLGGAGCGVVIGWALPVRALPWPWQGLLAVLSCTGVVVAWWLAV